MRRISIPAVALGLLALLGHRWLALGWNAWKYPVAGPTARTQVVVSGGWAYLAAGVDGIEVVDLSARHRPVVVKPETGADRIDDLALADGWLFALDATPPGHLMTYSLANPALPAPSGPIEEVPVGPFSGVAAAAGVVIVSGGTSRLTLREYEGNGQLGREVVTGDFGRGQPDVSLRPDGAMAAISTHLYGPEFALTLVAIRRRPLRLETLGRLALKEAGFTSGGFKPAHFPLVTAWRGSRVYVAEGGGLDVIDVSDPARPRLLLRDRLPRPAMDLAIAGEDLDVIRAGSRPALFRYRLDPSGLPTPSGVWIVPSGIRPAALAREGSEALITEHERGWQVVPRSEISPIHPGQP